jgi:hypothetical protein
MKIMQQGVAAIMWVDAKVKFGQDHYPIEILMESILPLEISAD